MTDAGYQLRSGPSGYDAELSRHNEALRGACGIRFRDHILDIGCGTGFDDPAAAFANIRRALHPAGRLVMMVWQARERNEWDVVIRQSLAAAEAPAAIPSGGPDPFSLADPPAVTQILAAAGFAGVAFTDVREPVYYRPDVSAALDWARGFRCTSEMLKRLDPAAAARAVGRLRDAFAAHQRDDGVWFSSRAWIVTARRH